MKAEIIAVGSEIMLGDINNSHARYISRELASLGIDVCYHSAVGDNEERLKEIFTQALIRSDIVITTGGLGPTSDDITKEVISRVIKVPLVEDEKVLNDIKNFFARIGKEMPQQNAKQAMVPLCAKIVPNRFGTAPGLILESENRERIIIMLPGPPNELIPMFEGEIYEYLKSLSGSVILSKNLRIAGIGESRVEMMTEELLKGSNPSAALYAKPSQVRIRVTAKAESESQAEEMLTPLIEKFRQKLGDTIYSEDDEELEEVVVRLLAEKQLKLATAESCTGGLLSEKLTSVSGASDVFEFGIAAYSNSVKKNILGVSSKTLYLYGAVSEHTAIEMALGAQKKAKADIGVGITGFAGPGGGNEHNPVGTVYIAVARGSNVWSTRITAGHGKANERGIIREAAAITALDMVRHVLLETPKASLYLRPVKEVLESLCDPIVNEGEYTPVYKKIIKALIPMKGEPLTEIIRKSVVLASAAVFITALSMLGVYMNEKIESDKIINMTQALYTAEPTDEQLYKLPYAYLDKFAALYSVNDDVRGWISIPNSKMSFPVVKGEDNDYYLSHDFYKNYNSNGVPFLDYRSSIEEDKKLDDNTIIYAHNIRGGRFFAELCNYQDLEYYKERPVITFDSVYEEMKWKIVACYITNADKEQDNGNIFMYNNYINFDSTAQFDWYVEEVMRRSIIDTGVDVEYGDFLLTLSTCTYEFDNARFVILARKVRPGEDESVDTSKAAYAKNPLYPQAWYDKHGGQKPNLPPNPEPSDYYEEIVSEEEIPFYELMSSNKSNTASIEYTPPKEPFTQKSATSSKPFNRVYYSSTKTKYKTISSNYSSYSYTSSASKKKKNTSSKKSVSSKDTSSKATSSKNTSSKKTSSKTTSSKNTSSKKTSSKTTSSNTKSTTTSNSESSK